MSERIDVFYKEFTHIPVVMQTQGEIGRTLPVSVSLTRGNLNVATIVEIERPVLRIDRIPVHIEHWIPAESGVPGNASSKLPIVIRVWNYVVGSIQVVAHVVAHRFQADITGSFPGSIGGEESYPKIKIIYRVWDVIKQMTRLLPNIEYKTDRVIGIHVNTFRERFNALVTAIFCRKMKQGVSAISTHIEHGQQQTIGLITRIQHALHGALTFFVRPKKDITYTAAFRAVVREIPITYRAKFKAAILRLETLTPAKFVAFLLPIDYYMNSRLHIYTKRAIDLVKSKFLIYLLSPVQRFWPFFKINPHNVEQNMRGNLRAYLHRTILAPTRAAIQVKTISHIQQAYGLLKAHLLTPVQSYTRAIFVYPKRVEIAKVLAYIKVLFIWFKRRPHVIVKHYEVKRKQLIFSNLNFVRRVHTVILNTYPITRIKQIYFNSMNVLRTARIYLSSWQQRLKHNVLWNIKKVTRPSKIIFPITENIREMLVQFDVLTTLAEENVSFVTGHRTVQVKIIALLFAKAQQFARLQWWVRQINMANEGYSMEIIFDLDEKGQGIGPLPPLGVESWEGGYVEYPFKGMGTQTTEEATGYLSPEGLSWVKNASMIWGKATPIFDGQEEEDE